ncbi:hypothetical protein Q0M53_13935, partial [Staphylococcus aureus]|nr:hypothetical protein [Staphylococcus aureus]
QMKVEAPIEAQPIDPAEGIDVYDRSGDAPATAPTYAPPPEAVLPRPTTPATTPPPATKAPETPAPAEKAETPAAGGTSGVQIGA